MNTLLAEITKQGMLVTVDGIVVNKRPIKSSVISRKRTAFNFTIKDIMGDTANVVFWDRSAEIVRIDQLILFGSVFRFGSMKSVAISPSSARFSPRTTCQFLLQMYQSSVEKVPTQTENKLLRIFNHLPLMLNQTSLAKLMMATTSFQVNVMALVIGLGEERQIITQSGEEIPACDIELADDSMQTVLITVWGREFISFTREQIIVWESVLFVQDANVQVSQNRGIYLSTNSQTLITFNVVQRHATAIQRTIEKARAKGFKAEKIYRVSMNIPKISPDLPPQWTTLETVNQFCRGKFSADKINPYKPLVSIVILTGVRTVNCSMVCPMCDSVSNMSDPPGNRACESCRFVLGSDCMQISSSVQFSDACGGMKVCLNHEDSTTLLGRSCLSMREEEVNKALLKRLFKRFVLVFQIISLHQNEDTLTLRTIRLREPSSEDWSNYFQVTRAI